MKRRLTTISLLTALLCSPWATADAQQVAEKLNRGAVAVKGTDGILVSWRSLLRDGENATFNVYRDGVKINSEPIKNVTNYLDKEGVAGAEYSVEMLDGGAVTETETVTAWDNIYTTLQLSRPTASGYTYTPNDMSVGDVDGDGDYELVVKWDPSNSQDNSIKGVTGNTIFDCYEFTGEKKWRIDLGPNVRAGAHYSPFLVYDFDGDGKAEFVVKTAPGTKDSDGKYVSEAATDETIKGITTNGEKFANSAGHITKGEEFLTVFNGETGRAINTVWYWPNMQGKPASGSTSVAMGSEWGKSDGGNRGHRYNACVAYLDGLDKLPSIIMQRGYYMMACFWAVDFDGAKLTTRWLHRGTTAKEWQVLDKDGKQISSGTGKSSYGQGVHGISVGDVDLDGLDEIVMGGATIDNDGKLLCSTGKGHGDAIHLTDLCPDRPGLEIMMPHEEKPYGYDVHDATTGELIVSATSDGDNGRGVAADMIPDGENRGFEFWSSADNLMRDCQTGNTVLEKKPDTNFRIYWDGGIYDQTFDGRYDSSAKKCAPRLRRYDPSSKSIKTFMEFSNYGDPQTCNTTKGTPCLQADILGDWREELIMWSLADPSKVMIYSTPIETKYGIGCLMEDHVYRMGVAWQNASYNQPPHLGYYLPDVFETNPSIGLQSGAMTQSVRTGKEIEPFTLKWRHAESVSVSGLPEGVSASIDNDTQTVTVSGTPTADGTYTVTVTTTGMEDPTAKAATLKGVITVKDADVLEAIASFKFDENLTNDVTGTDATAGDYTPNYTTGVSGKAIDFRTASATTSRVAQAHYDKLNLGTQSFTLSFWFATPSTENQYIFHKGSVTNDAAAGTSGKWIGVEYKNGNLTFAIDDDATKSACTVKNATTLLDGKWHNLVCVRNTGSKTLEMYVDGALAATATDATGDISEAEEMVVGNATVSYNQHFMGILDELMIYTGAIEPEQVASDYAALQPTQDPDAPVTALRPVVNENGADGEAYDLGGRKVSPDEHGIVIQGNELRLNK